jgi:diguanylate cyclase (GGDEF)-like protein/PAS domain S-box-containing protein
MPLHLIIDYWPLSLAIVVVVSCGVLLRSARQQLAENRLNVSKAEADWIQALDFAEDAMYLVDLDDRLVRGNRKFFEFIGRPAAECLGKPVMQLIHGADEKSPCPVCKARMERRDAVFVKEANDPINRLRRPIEFTVKTRRDAHGEPVGVLMVMRDLSRQRQAEEAILESRERLMVTLESMGEAVITTDVNGVVQYLNPVAQHLTGWGNADAPGRPLAEVFRLTEDSTGSHARDPVAACLEQDAAISSDRDSTLRRRDNQEFAIEHTTAPIRDRNGKVIGVVLIFRDITQIRSMARQLTYQATHDTLTGLINRREFELRLEHALDSSRTDGRHHALCYLDLDQFKLVNDTCGHIAGDALLRQLTTLLKSKLRDNDLLARLGGDEFGVLLEGCPLPKAIAIAETLRVMVCDFRFVWMDKSFEIGISIGLVPISEQFASVTELLSAADTACYVAKDLGRNRVHAYEPDDAMLAKHQGEMHWVQRITKAIDDNRLHLYCQPIVALHEDNRALPSFEILVRLQDEHGQIVPPMAFIPAAERYSVMVAVDRWVLRAALDAWQRVCAACASERVMFSINISGTSLCNDNYLAFVLDTVAKSSMPGECLCFEITETAAVSNFQQAQRFITALRELGCRFALDDFGCGLSSFTYLKNLAVDYLKIDGSFVRDMAQDPIDYAMVESINQLGHVMGIQTVAEFVENTPTLERLRQLGVDFAQGYALSKPVPLFDAHLSLMAESLVASAQKKIANIDSAV